jgi:RimJ/RimL family protein N-acetyltransferase
MDCIIETERLKLRELNLKDMDKLSLVLSDPESMKFYSHPFTKEDVENWINWNVENYKKYGFGLWAVIIKDTNEFIGDCGITRQKIEDNTYPEIGYHIRKEYCRKGYASEAAKACMDFAFNKKCFPRIISYMKHDNIPSRGVAEKNGMKFVKTFQKVVFGNLVDDEVLYMKENK